MNTFKWVKFAFKYGIRTAIYYWREDRKPENAPKVRVDSNTGTSRDQD